MIPVDWCKISEAIREGRFSDILPENWPVIADKLEGKKRGKGRPVVECKGPWTSAFWKRFDRVCTYSGKRMTGTDRMLWVEDRFEELRTQGIKPTKAINQIGEEIGRGVKTIESDLAEIRKVRKVEKDIYRSPSKTCQGLHVS